MPELLVASLLLIAMPFVTSSLLVTRMAGSFVPDGPIGPSRLNAMELQQLEHARTYGCHR